MLLKNQGKVVNIIWQTVSEINNEEFLVHRSSDIHNWILISTMKGAGNSNELRSYRTVDSLPQPGLNYYRLSQRDFNGKEEKFNPVAVNFNSNQTVSKLFPSPAEEFVILNQKFENENVDLSIVDINGKTHLKIMNAHLEGDFITIDVKRIPSGLYLLRVHRYGKVENYRFVKK